MANPKFAIEPLFQSGTGAARETHEISQDAPRPVLEPRAELARLAALHLEAEETARLANLLGRSSSAALFLGLGAGLVLALTMLSAAPEAATAWLILMALGFGVFTRLYLRAIRAPFERAVLVRFATDLTTIETYLGFAWGAGAFLLLPADCGFAAALAYVALPAAGLLGVLRAREPSLAFLVPAGTLSAFAMVLRPLPNGALAAALAVLITGGLALVALRFDRGQESLPVFAKQPPA
jgi:hypothetical protein